MAPIRRLDQREVNYSLKHPHPLGKNLKILYWNIWYGSKPADVLAAIKRFDCDALFLFEANGNNNLLEDIHQLGYGGRFIETNRFGIVKKIRGGIAFFSRLHTGYVRNYELLQARRGLWRGGKESRRCYLEAKLCVPGYPPIIAGGTHLSYKVPLIGNRSYGRETSALRRETAKHRLRYIVGGDFNADKDSQLIESLQEGLRYLPAGKDSSWPVRRIIQCLPHRLFDHALVTHDLGEVKAEFMEDYSSDHLPLIVTVPLGNDQ